MNASCVSRQRGTVQVAAALLSNVASHRCPHFAHSQASKSPSFALRVCSSHPFLWAETRRCPPRVSLNSGPNSSKRSTAFAAVFTSRPRGCQTCSTQLVRSTNYRDQTRATCHLERTCRSIPFSNCFSPSGLHLHPRCQWAIFHHDTHNKHGLTLLPFCFTPVQSCKAQLRADIVFPRHCLLRHDVPTSERLRDGARGTRLHHTQRYSEQPEKREIIQPTDTGQRKPTSRYGLVRSSNILLLRHCELRAVACRSIYGKFAL